MSIPSPDPTPSTPPSPAPPADSPANDARNLVILLAVMTALRIVYALTMPMIAGESYYWLWGLYPAAGYFDHPPLNGLINWVATSHANGSALIARAPCMLLAALATLGVYALTRELYPTGRTPWRAAFLFSIIPIFDLNAVFVGPDNSLLLAMVLTWWLFWRAANRSLTASASTIPLWLLAGIPAGFALLAKFHAWVLLPPLWLFLWLSPRHRPLLRTPGPWLAVVVALVVLSPNLLWNAQHGWLNYAFQMQRSGLTESGFEPKNILHYLLGPILSLSPFVYWALLKGIDRGWKFWKSDADPRPLFLLCAGLPLPVFLGLLTPLTKISLHWPATGYVPLIILMLGLTAELALFDRRFSHRMLVTAAAMTALIHLAPFVVMRLPDGLVYKLEPLADTSRFKQKFLGWPEIATVAERHRLEMQAADPTRPSVIMARNWHLAAQLAFYGPSPREVFVYSEEDAHNFALWMAERDMLRGANVVVVIEKKDPEYKHSRLRKKYDKFIREIAPLFARVDYQPSLMINRDGSTTETLTVETDPNRLQEFLIFQCKGWKGELGRIWKSSKKKKNDNDQNNEDGVNGE